MDGLEKQERLPGVTIVGVGGLGSPVALTLAKQGFPLTLYDHDKVEEKNTRNQLYGPVHLGQYKVEALRYILGDLKSPEYMYPTVKRCKVTKQTTFYTPIVVCCVDSLAARFDVFMSAKRSLNVKVFVDGRLGGTTVKVLVLNPHNKKDEKEYLKTLEGQVVLGCAQQFEGHIALIGAGMVVRAVRMAYFEESVERLMIFETHGLHILKDGPHPL